MQIIQLAESGEPRSKKHKMRKREDKITHTHKTVLPVLHSSLDRLVVLRFTNKGGFQTHVCELLDLVVIDEARCLENGTKLRHSN